MITELIVVSFATMTSWEILRYTVWFRLPVRLSPLLVTLMAYLWTMSIHRSLVLAAAATAGVILLHKLTGAEGIDPWSVSDIPQSIRSRIPVIRKRKAPPKIKTSYIPTL